MLFWELDLRLYIGPLVFALGLLMASRGARRSWRALGLEPRTPGKNVLLMSGFRRLIVGTAVALVALGWALQSVALVATAGIIGAGEMFETSFDVWALKQQTWTYGASSRPRSAGSSRMAPKV
jgi:hypothetical protein